MLSILIVMIGKRCPDLFLVGTNRSANIGFINRKKTILRKAVGFRKKMRL